MPLLLIPFLGAAFTGLMTWIARFFVIKTVFNVAILAVLISLVTSAVNALFDIFFSFTAQLLSQLDSVPFVAFILPDNLSFCLTAYISVKIACSTYVFAVDLLKTNAAILK